MLTGLQNWLDNRTGFRKFTEVMLLEDIPGGAKWRYVWGSCLAFVFGIQLITGICLMTAYSPSSTSAWESVYFIQYQMDFGWLIRGLHHFGSQTMVVLLAIHMLQVVIAGAHLPPREVNWWLGLGLLGVVLGLSLTGYLLPWDQKGFWATQVATNIAGNLPVLGSFLQKIAVGGPDYGHHTLTRFFALHVAVLPGIAIVLLAAHVAIFRRHGITAPKNATGEGWFWPDQAFKDLVVCMLIFAVMVGLVLKGHAAKLEPTSSANSANPEATAAAPPSAYERVAHLGREGAGANLDAPADPARPYPARPEWYFLFLFQLLKYFEGAQEIIGTVIIPAGAGLALFLLPLLGYGRMRPFGHFVGVVVVLALIGGVLAMTYLALDEDRFDKSLALKYFGMTEAEFDANDPELNEAKTKAMSTADRLAAERNEKARLFHKELKRSEEFAARAIALASAGIPADGAIHLLRRDPLTKGPTLFREQCGACHNHAGIGLTTSTKASDLAGWGTEDWNFAFLKNPGDKRFLGHTGFSEMAGWQDSVPEEVTAEKKEADIKTVAKWLASGPRSKSLQASTDEYKAGLKAFEELHCTECHRFEGEGNGVAPDLAGYGSADWLRGMIMAPHHRLRYGKNNQMPAFRDLDVPEAEQIRQEFSDRAKPAAKPTKDGKAERPAKPAKDDKPTKPAKDEKEKKADKTTKADAEKPVPVTPLMHLSAVDRELIIRWLTGDHRVIFGGDPILTK